MDALTRRLAQATVTATLLLAVACGANEDTPGDAEETTAAEPTPGPGPVESNPTGAHTSEPDGTETDAPLAEVGEVHPLDAKLGTLFDEAIVKTEELFAILRKGSALSDEGLSGAGLIVEAYDPKTMTQVNAGAPQLDVAFGCSETLVATDDGRHLVLGYERESTPAQGIEDPADTGYLVAHELQDDSADWEEVWRVDLGHGGSCKEFSVTADGGFALTPRADEDGNFRGYLVIDTADGQSQASDGDDLQVNGKYVSASVEDGRQFLDPATLQVAHTFPDSQSRGPFETMVATPRALIDQTAGVGVETTAYGYDGEILWSNDDWFVTHYSRRHGALFAGIENSPSESDNETARVDPATAEVLWSVDAAVDVCGTTHSQVIGVANEQIVVLDIETGEQITYYDALDTDRCPKTFHRGFFSNDDGSAYVTDPVTK